MIEMKNKFTPSMKMSDLIDIDYNLLGVLSRLGLHPGFGDDTVEEACKKIGISTDTFLQICGVYAFDGYLPAEESLRKSDLHDIVHYLRESHSYYMDIAVKELADAIERMIAPCDDKYKRIIWKFFTDYKEELSKHFAYEEEMVFPYVEAVLDHHGAGDYRISDYESHHSNVQEKLGDLRNIVMKYLPRNCDQSQVYTALLRLCILKEDLEKHTIIEDEILIPVVARMEENDKQ